MNGSGIYFGRDEVALKKYSSATSSGPRGKTVVRIELEISDHYALASVLRQLDEIDADQRRAAAPKKPAPKPLALPYYGADQ